jgi:hypothetical protein
MRQRVRVIGYRKEESSLVCIVLRRKLGGRLDGVWLTSQLLVEEYSIAPLQDT